MRNLLIVSVLLATLLAAPCLAELHLLDANGNDLGILISTSTKHRIMINRDYTRYYGHGYYHMIFHPISGYTYEIKTFTNSSHDTPPGDITRPQDIMYTKTDCSGTKYTNSFIGLENGLVKVGKSYFKTVPVTKGATVKSYSVLVSDGNYTSCYNYSEPRNDGDCSRLVPISKPFEFLPAKLPLKIVDK